MNLFTLYEPAGEPRFGGVSERRGDLPEPDGSVAGGVHGVGGVVAAQVGTPGTPCPSAQVNRRTPAINKVKIVLVIY